MSVYKNFTARSGFFAVFFEYYSTVCLQMRDAYMTVSAPSIYVPCEALGVGARPLDQVFPPSGTRP